jgi:hypothetical protein
MSVLSQITPIQVRTQNFLLVGGGTDPEVI